MIAASVASVDSADKMNHFNGNAMTNNAKISLLICRWDGYPSSSCRVSSYFFDFLLIVKDEREYVQDIKASHGDTVRAFSFDSFNSFGGPNNGLDFVVFHRCDGRHEMARTGNDRPKTMRSKRNSQPSSIRRGIP